MRDYEIAVQSRTPCSEACGSILHLVLHVLFEANSAELVSATKLVNFVFVWTKADSAVTSVVLVEMLFDFRVKFVDLSVVDHANVARDLVLLLLT